MPDSANGGFALGSGQGRSLWMNNWGGRFWARTGCDWNGKNCATGDCTELQCNGKGGQPDVTLIEITTRGTPNEHGPAADHDYYDVSHVDAHNLPATIQAVNGRAVGSGPYDQCQPATCPVNLVNNCPEKYREYKNGQVVSCLSACTWANMHGITGQESDRYCCRNQYNTPHNCPGAADNQYFKNNCPKAYSFAYDDLTSTFHCNSDKYVLTWC